MPDQEARQGPPAVPMDVTPGPAGPSPDAAPRRRPRARTIALGTLLAVGVAGVAAAGVTGLRISQQKDATLAVPGQIGGLVRDPTSAAAEAAEDLRSALSAEVELQESVGAVYAEGAGGSTAVLFFGGTGLLWRPERELDSVLALVADESGDLSDRRTVPAGDLGGVMKCGSLALAGSAMAVCGWADHGSVAVGMFPERELEPSAELFRDIRAAVQSRS